jgi:site-specific recombinase XerD
MFTINFKSKSGSPDVNQIKIEMIIYCPGYARVPKVTKVIGLARYWDEKTQMFLPKSPDATKKNGTLSELKAKYETVAKQWDKEGKSWSPRQLSHCFETEEKKKDEVKVLPVSECIDFIVKNLKQRKRFKNSKILTSVSTAKNYTYLKDALCKFTEEKYGRKFSAYFFNEINEQFVMDFVLYTQEQGVRNGNKAGLVPKLKTLYGVFFYSNKLLNMPDTDVAVLKCTKELIKRKKAEPQTISYDLIRKIEAMDKSKFSKLERFYIDVFLFSFYAGGIIGIDVCYLTWSCIENNLIRRERVKFPKEAVMPFNDKARAIAEKYKEKCHDDYVLPLFTHKHTTEAKQRTRLLGVRANMAETLKKVAKKLRCKEFGWYAARGTFITKMLDEGFHPIAVAEFAGNSPKTIYNHYWKQTRHEDVLQSMNQMF